MEKSFKIEVMLPGKSEGTQLTVYYELSARDPRDPRIEDITLLNDDDNNKEIPLESLPGALQMKINDAIDEDASFYVDEAYIDYCSALAESYTEDP